MQDEVGRACPCCISFEKRSYQITITVGITMGKFNKDALNVCYKCEYFPSAGQVSGRHSNESCSS